MPPRCENTCIANTLAFRVVDSRGKFRSSVLWVLPQELPSWTAEDVRAQWIEAAAGRGRDGPVTQADRVSQEP